MGAGGRYRGVHYRELETKPHLDAPNGVRSPASPMRTVLSGFAVVGLCMAMIAGTQQRDRLDRAHGAGADEPLAGIVASRQKDAGGINLDAYYDEVEEILKEQYVEPITDDQKLAVGAVRGMVTSLGDPRSQFMDKDAFAAYQQAQDGHFSGIGVDFDLEPTNVDLTADDPTSSDTDPTSD